MAVIFGGPGDASGDQRQEQSQNESLKSHGGWDTAPTAGRNKLFPHTGETPRWSRLRCV